MWHSCVKYGYIQSVYKVYTYTWLRQKSYTIEPDVGDSFLWKTTWCFKCRLILRGYWTIMKWGWCPQHLFCEIRNHVLTAQRTYLTCKWKTFLYIFIVIYKNIFIYKSKKVRREEGTYFTLKNYILGINRSILIIIVGIYVQSFIFLESVQN